MADRLTVGAGGVATAAVEDGCPSPRARPPGRRCSAGTRHRPPSACCARGIDRAGKRLQLTKGPYFPSRRASAPPHSGQRPRARRCAVPTEGRRGSGELAVARAARAPASAGSSPRQKASSTPPSVSRPSSIAARLASRAAAWRSSTSSGTCRSSQSPTADPSLVGRSRPFSFRMQSRVSSVATRAAPVEGRAIRNRSSSVQQARSP